MDSAFEQLLILLQRYISPVNAQQGKSTPAFLGTRRYVDMGDDSLFEWGVEELLREIHDAPKTIKPRLGTNPFRRRR